MHIYHNTHTAMPQDIYSAPGATNFTNLSDPPKSNSGELKNSIIYVAYM